MSFVCQIWEYPAPASAAEAHLILDALHGEDPSDSSRFVELARRLTARHPCITTLDDDDEDQAVWTDGPLDGRAGSAVYNIGILSQHIDRVFPFVCETANDLGLNVYEMVAGSVHRADGRVLEHDPEEEGGRRPFPMGIDIAKVAAMLGAAVEPLVRGQGFRKLGFDHVRGFEGGWQSFAIEVAESAGRLEAAARIRTHRYDVMRLVHSLDRERHGGDPGGCTFELSTSEFLRQPLGVSTPDELHAAAPILKLCLERHLLAAGEECTTLAGLHDVMNTERTRSRRFPLNHLIVARLVDSRDYDALYRRMRDEGHVTEAKESFFSCIREVVAMVVPSKHETVVHSSYGPGGSKVGILGPGR